MNPRGIVNWHMQSIFENELKDIFPMLYHEYPGLTYEELIQVSLIMERYSRVPLDALIIRNLIRKAQEVGLHTGEKIIVSESILLIAEFFRSQHRYQHWWSEDELNHDSQAAQRFYFEAGAELNQPITQMVAGHFLIWIEGLTLLASKFEVEVQLRQSS